MHVVVDGQPALAPGRDHALVHAPRVVEQQLGRSDLQQQRRKTVQVRVHG
jgi:hypothetical protein